MRKITNQELDRLSQNEFIQAPKREIILVLDNVRSMQNVGSIFRTADAFLIKQIILCGITATPPHRDILKTALGATETVDWKYVESTQDAIQDLLQQQYRVAVVEQVEQATSLQHFIWDSKPIALVFGHEVNGVSQEVVDQSQLAIEIPQWGSKHSFNVAVSAGIVLWQLVGVHT